MKKRFFGPEFYAGRKFQIPGLDEREALARDIAKINDDERELLKKDFASMDPSEVYFFLSAMAVVKRLPSLVTIAAESRDKNTKSFSHEHTLSLIRLALTYNEDDDYDLSQARVDIASLIRSLNVETRLNVIGGLANLPDDAKFLISGNKDIDEELSKNLEKSSKFGILNSDIRDVVRSLSKLNMPKTLGVLIELLKKSGDKSSIEQTLQDLYLSSAINNEYFQSINLIIGNSGLVNLAKEYLNIGSGRLSLNTILSNNDEDAIIGDAELKESLRRTIRLGTPCNFFADIITGRLEPCEYPKSSLFIIDNFSKISSKTVNPPSANFVKYAVEQGKAVELVNGLELAYREDCANKSEELHYRDFDFRKLSMPDFLKILHREPYRNEYAFSLRRSSLVKTISIAGILNFKDLTERMDDDVADAFVKHLDIMPRKAEVLKKCMKIRQHAFTRDLGL